jgi:beta-glucosidase
VTNPAHPTRRSLLAAAAHATLTTTEVAARSVSSERRGAVEPTADTAFPDDFRWGTATSAYQIEGATTVDGRGPSIWDTFCREPGKIRDGSNGDVSVDHYHRYKEDVALMKSLGARTYRFSIAWPRVFPAGRGKLNPDGLAFYDRLVDELLAQDIEPFPTLYHWDLPQALQDKGGWERRDTAYDFADYAGAVAAKLGDRVQNFFTLNEMQSFIEHGYGIGIFAPGLKLPPDRLAQAKHHAVLAHGLGVQAIRASGRAATRVGPAENLTVALPAFEIPAHVRAAEFATRELNAAYLTVMMEGRYTDAYLKELGADAPKVEGGDLKIISSPVDFVGINVYTPGPYVLSGEAAPGYQLMKWPKSYPHMASTWLRLAPEVLYWAPRLVARLWKPAEIHISENGTSSKDKPDKDGHVYDLDRVMYLRNCLTQLHRATREGVPVRGYFLWSLLDNFEWADGYATRFGLVHVDFATQKRTPKLSAAFYKEVMARNAPA